MAQPRTEILEWVAQGRIAGADVRRALELGEALPTKDGWRRFLDRILAFMSAVLLAAALVFFLAYNWRDLDRFAKFALAQAPIIAALALIWRTGLDGLAGKALALAVALLTGALLALVGQVYQTGADTFELFAAWAVAILPWVVLARFAALWIVWLALLNLAAIFYFRVMPGLIGWIFVPEHQLWALFALNTVALVAWEAAATRFAWIREGWAIRLVATASGACATVLAVMGLFEWRGSYWNVIAWAAWVAAAYYFYRHWSRDLYVLAGGALSVIVVATAFLTKALHLQDAGAFLLTGLAVIGMSAAAGYWLRNVAAEADA